MEKKSERVQDLDFEERIRYIRSPCESGAAVAHLVANERVASSNLVFRF